MHRRFVVPLLVLAFVVAAVVWYRVRQGHDVARIMVPDGGSVEVQPYPVVPRPARLPIELTSTPATASPIELDEPTPPKILATNRPSWADIKPGFEGDVYSAVVVAGPYETRQECDDRLGPQLSIAAEDYIERVLGTDASQRVTFPVAFLRSNTVLREQWEEPIWSPRNNREMVQLHALIEFDKTARKELDRRWHAVQVEQRLWYTAGGSAGALAILGTLFGFLRLGSKPSP